MKGFIKVTDLNGQQYYLNTNYIVQFIPLTEDHDGNAMITVTGTTTVSEIHTSTTAEEIAYMINLISK